MKSDRIAVRLPSDLNRRLEQAASPKARAHDPYVPSKSDIVVRGIELALAELDRKNGK